jgi:hypothetical protein
VGWTYSAPTVGTDVAVCLGLGVDVVDDAPTSLPQAETSSAIKHRENSETKRIANPRETTA